MRIGLAGVGRIGAFHAATLRDLDAVDSLLLVDAVPGRAADVAASLAGAGAGDRAARVEHVDSPDALFAAGIDALVIATATDAHADLIVRGVDQRLPVFCEKPVALDLAATIEVLKRVQAADVPVQIGFQRRFDAGYAAARRAVADGRLGWLHTVRAGTLDPAPPPAAYIATSGGILRDCGVHDFDAIRWVTGAEVVEVFVTGGNRGADFFAAANDVDTAAVVSTLSDGTVAEVSLTRYNGAGYDVRLELLGSAGSMCVGLDDRLPLRSAQSNVDFPAGEPYPNFIARFLDAYRSELAAFVEVVAGRGEVACTVEDALEACYIAEAGELSRQRHCPVTLAEVRA